MSIKCSALAIYTRFTALFFYRLVNMPVTSLSPAEQNRIELQIWAPSLQQYLKVREILLCP